MSDISVLPLASFSFDDLQTGNKPARIQPLNALPRKSVFRRPLIYRFTISVNAEH